MIRDNSIKAVFPKKRIPHYPEDLTPDRVKQVRTFHESVDGYAVAPLCRLPELAGRLGLNRQEDAFSQEKYEKLFKS